MQKVFARLTKYEFSKELSRRAFFSNAQLTASFVVQSGPPQETFRISNPADSFISVRRLQTACAVQEQNELDKLYKRLEIELRGNEPAVLKSYSYFATTAAGHLGIEVGLCWAPRKAAHDRLTLLRSIHVKKKCRVQYEMRTYFRFMQFHRLTGSTADTFLEYIQRMLPEGVAMKVSRVAIEAIPEHIKPPDARGSAEETSPSHTIEETH